MIKSLMSGCLLLLVLAGVVFAQTGAPSGTAAATSSTTMRYGCARSGDGLLRYVSTLSKCGAREKRIDLKKQAIGTCVLVQRTGGHPKSILGRIHKGATRVVSSATKCKDPSYGREVPLVLPDYKDRSFCAVSGPGQIRIRRRQDPCRHGRSIVIRKRVATPTLTPTATATATATATPTATPAPAAPRANDDAAATDEDTAKDIDVVANDTSGTPPLKVSSVGSENAKGAVSLNANGTLRYDPAGTFDALAAGATATDTFTYQATDESGRTAGPATVTVTLTGVDDAPVLAGVETAPLTYFTGDPATPVTSAITVADVDSTSLPSATVAITSGYDKGHDVLSGGTFDADTGVLTLTGPFTKAQLQDALRAVKFVSPGGATGDRAITFRAADGSAQSAAVARTVTVDRAPDATGDSQTLDEDAGATTIDVLANDTNPDGGPLTITSVGAAAHGTASAATDGQSISYTPDADACGPDSFTYTLNGGSTATVSVTVTCVNDAPVNTVPGAQTTDEDTALSLSPTVGDVDSANLAVTLSAGHGTLSPATTSGTAAEVNAALADLTYTPDADFSGSDTITLTTSDGTATDADTIAVTVAAVNDAPVNTVPGSLTTDEDTPVSFQPSVTDVDAGSERVSVTLTASTGSVVPSVVTGTVAEVNADLADAEYTPQSDANGSDTITMTTSDLGHTGSGGTQTDTDTISVTVTAVEDAPTADDQILTTDEDTAKAITLTGADADGDALTFTADSTSDEGGQITGTAPEVTYTPAADFCGSDAFDFEVDDGNGGTDTGTISITVTCANDAPVVTVPGEQTTDEDTAVTFAGDDAPTVADADDDDVSVTVTALHGTVDFGDADGTFSGTKAEVNAELDGFTYEPENDYNGTDTITVTADDGDATDAETIAVEVTAVNDAPVNTVPEPVTTDEDTSLAITDLSVSDVEADDVEVTLTVGHGTLSVGDDGTATLVLQGSVADVNASLADLVYTPDADFNGSDTLTVATDDGGQTGNGGPLTTTDTVDITVTPVNDAPTLALNEPFAISFTENDPDATIFPNVVAGDVDAGTTISSATVEITTGFADGQDELVLPAASTLSPNTSLVATRRADKGRIEIDGDGSPAEYQAAIRSVKYRNTSEDPTPGNRNVQATISDDQGASGAADRTIAVSAVNDAPVLDLDTTADGTDSNAAFAEAVVPGAGTQIAPNAAVSDVDATNLEGATVTLTNAQDGAAEQLTVDTGTTNITATGSGSGTITLAGADTAANYAAVLRSIRYRNTATSPNPTTRSITVTVSDGTANSDTATAHVTVVALDIAPDVDLDSTNQLSADSTATYVEDAAAVAIAPNATVTDVDDTNLESATATLVSRPDGDGAEALAVTSTSGTSGITVDAYKPSTGVLLLHGSGTKADYQTLLRRITYVNSSQAPSAADRTVSVVVSDGDKTSTPRSAVVAVTPVNDAPVNRLPAAQTTVEDTTLTFSAANGNAITISDADAGTGSLTVALSATGGTPSATSFTGTVASINAQLDGLTFTPSPDFNGAAGLTITTNDQGNTGSGGAKNDIDPLAITVTAVNDPPVNTVPDSVTVNEDTPLVFNGTLSVADVDAGTGSVSVSIGVTHGGVTLSRTTGLTFTTGDGINDASMTFSGTLANVNAALNGASYLGASNDNGSDTLTFTSNDLGNTGSGGAKSDTDTTSITVTPVNDPPVAGDDTFSGARSAIGNTTLNVDDPSDGRLATPDPTDTSPVTDRPHKTITGDILANDADPDSAAAGLTVVPGTFATNDGGTVTIQSDGDFNFEPAPTTSCTDTSDFFDYTVTDGDATPMTDTGRVTIAITGCVWYVDNNDAQGNSGTSEKPFDTLAQAQTASRTGDSIFLYDGDDTTTGYDAGITLKAGQSLLSEAADLVVGADTLHAADAANKASLKNTNADVVTLSTNDTVKGLNIDPQGTGGGIFGGTAGTSAVTTIDDVNVVDSGTKGTQPGLELAGTSGTTTNVSNLTVNNGDGSSATTGDEGVRLDNAGTVNFATAGTISITTNGAAGLDAAAGSGTTSLGAASTFDAITVTNSGNGGVSLAGTTGSGTAFGDGSGNDLQLTTVSGGAAAFGVATAGAFSVPSAGQSDLSATGGPAVSVSGSSGSTMPFDAVSSTNSATQAVNLSGLGTGTFSGTSGTFGGFAGTAVVISGGAGAITMPMTINNGAGDAVSITGRTGGVISLSGSMSDTSDAGGGITESGNTGGSDVFGGATKQYNTGASPALTVSNPDGSTHTVVWSGGGTDIDTTSGNGVSVTGVGPTADGSIQFSGSGNTLDSSALAAGNRALNIADVNLTSTGVTFDHVASVGGANGVRLNNTGSAGALRVTGVGGTCTAADQSGCSGGRISGAGGAGIDLAGVGNGAVLTHMNVTNGNDDGVRANAVTRLTLSDSTITNNGTAGVPGENGLDWTNVNGASALQNTVVSGSADFDGALANTTGALDLTVSGNTFSGAGVDDGLQMEVDGSATVKSNVAGNTFTGNKGDAFQSGSSAPAASSSHDLTFTGNSITGKGGTNTDGGIVFDPNGPARANIAGNTIAGVGVSAIIVNPRASAGQFDATVNNNDIGTAGVQSSGTDAGGDGIQVKSITNGQARIAVTNNRIRGWSGDFGLLIRESEATGNDTDVTATGNVLTDGNPNGFAALYLQSGSGSNDTGSLCVDPRANTYSGSSNIAYVAVDERFSGATMAFPGYTGTTDAQLRDYFLSRNTGFVDVLRDGTYLPTNAGSSCSTPNPPTLPTAP